MSAAKKFLPVVGDPTIANCLACGFREECGGLDDQELLWGCMVRCGVDCGGPEVCDYTCPTKPRQFQRRWDEVGGMRGDARRPLQSPALESLPTYIPLLQHSYAREEILDLPVIALSTSDVLHVNRINGRYQPLDATEEGLRARYRLSPQTRILLISVATDDHLERYWERQEIDSLPAALSALRPLGMTVPNFSFFSCAPRFHTMWNRARMMRSAEQLVSAGVPIIPHLNAETRHDWEGWLRLLQEHENVHYVVKEFQTGLAKTQEALDVIKQLALLESRLGRPLHFLLVAARRFAQEIKALLPRFSVIESKPFEAAMHRKTAYLRRNMQIAWSDTPTAAGAPVDELLRTNIDVVTQWVDDAKPKMIRRTGAAAQLSFDWFSAVRTRGE